ncbi:hypothetical protein OEZ85_011076 [Tetradesmus obliquus]|uniref:Uncharacterized protein n=1 Tax=Tetradesmus obliquus TaxID=3088 RepID=A0ABY8TRI0_TETOB|nr:hypothetical protein OEZ85_011076 [Tetradesmus obliquus]
MAQVLTIKACVSLLEPKSAHSLFLAVFRELQRATNGADDAKALLLGPGIGMLPGYLANLRSKQGKVTQQQQDVIAELLGSLDGDLITFLMRNPKCIISGKAATRFDRIYMWVPAAEFCGILDHTSKIEDAFLRAHDVTGFGDGGSDSGNVAGTGSDSGTGTGSDSGNVTGFGDGGSSSSSGNDGGSDSGNVTGTGSDSGTGNVTGFGDGGSSSSSGGSGSGSGSRKRALSSPPHTPGMLMMALKKIAAEFKCHMEANDKRHNETANKLHGLQCSLTRVQQQ